MNRENKTTAIAAVLMIVGAALLLYFINDTTEKRDAKAAENATLEGEISTLEAKVATTESLQAELDTLRMNFAQYIKILPSEQVATEERLMEMLQDKAERSQFQITEFQRKPARERTAASGPSKKGGFQEIDVTLTAKGTFEQFLRFLNALERHESFVRVNSFNTTSKDEADLDTEGHETWPLTITLNISTFRFEAGK
jgi:Tfp pilus assembly protein PilO